MIKHRIRLLILTGLMVLSLGVFLGSSNSADDLTRGMIVYQSNCFPCHGEKGDGNGPEAPNYTPRPTDFTSPQMDSVPTTRIEKAIVEGVSVVPMHSFGGILSREDIEAVINFIRTF